MSLTSIVRGALTAPGADEAYVSYRGALESHATMDGGGILFRRVAGAWRRVAWYPAEWRDGCLALPDSMPMEMLCRWGDSHYDMAEEDTRVTATVPQPDQPETYRLSQPVRMVRDNTYYTKSL